MNEVKLKTTNRNGKLADYLQRKANLQTSRIPIKISRNEISTGTRSWRTVLHIKNEKNP